MQSSKIVTRASRRQTQLASSRARTSLIDAEWDELAGVYEITPGLTLADQPPISRVKTLPPPDFIRSAGGRHLSLVPLPARGSAPIAPVFPVSRPPASVAPRAAHSEIVPRARRLRSLATFASGLVAGLVVAFCALAFRTTPAPSVALASPAPSIQQPKPTTTTVPAAKPAPESRPAPQNAAPSETATSAATTRTGAPKAARRLRTRRVGRPSSDNPY